MNATITKDMADGPSRKVTAARAREMFSYDPLSGSVARLVTAGNRALAGMLAGSLDKDGYLVVKVDGRACKLHRLIWLIVTGDWPSGDIDHINSNRADNRWANLRDVPHSINNENQRRPRQDNKAGFLGVSVRPCGKFYATICCSGRVRHLGVFKTAEAAHDAYLNAKRKLHAGNTL